MYSLLVIAVVLSTNLIFVCGNDRTDSSSKTNSLKSQSKIAAITWRENLVAYQYDIALKASYFMKHLPSLLDVNSWTDQPMKEAEITISLSISFLLQEITNIQHLKATLFISEDRLDVKCLWDGLFLYLQSLRVNYVEPHLELQLLWQSQQNNMHEDNQYEAVSLANEMTSLGNLYNRIHQFLSGKYAMKGEIKAINDETNLINRQLQQMARLIKSNLQSSDQFAKRQLELLTRKHELIFLADDFMQDTLIFIDLIRFFYADLCTKSASIDVNSIATSFLSSLKAIVDTDRQDCKRLPQTCFYHAAVEAYQLIVTHLQPSCELLVPSATTAAIDKDMEDEEDDVGDNLTYNKVHPFIQPKYFRSSLQRLNVSHYVFQVESDALDKSYSICDLLHQENISADDVSPNRLLMVYFYLQKTLTSLLKKEINSNVSSCSALSDFVSIQRNLRILESNRTMNLENASPLSGSYLDHSWLYSPANKSWSSFAYHGGLLFDVFMIDVTSNDRTQYTNRMLMNHRQGNMTSDDVSSNSNQLHRDSKTVDIYEPLIFVRVPRDDHYLYHHKLNQPMILVENFGVQDLSVYNTNKLFRASHGGGSLSGIYLNCSFSSVRDLQIEINKLVIQDEKCNVDLSSSPISSCPLNSLRNKKDRGYTMIASLEEIPRIRALPSDSFCQIDHHNPRSNYISILLSHVLPLADFDLAALKPVTSTTTTVTEESNGLRCNCVELDSVDAYIAWTEKLAFSSMEEDSFLIPCPSALLIGLGGGTLHAAIYSHHPCVSILSVEIYEEMVITAVKAFGLNDFVCNIYEATDYFDELQDAALYSLFSYTDEAPVSSRKPSRRSPFRVNQHEHCRSKVVVGDGFRFLSDMARIINQINATIAKKNATAATGEDTVLLEYLLKLLSFDFVLFDVFDVDTIWSGQTGVGKSNGIFYHTMNLNESTDAANSKEGTPGNVKNDLFHNLQSLVRGRNGIVAFYLHIDSIYESFKNETMERVGPNSLIELAVSPNAGVLVIHLTPLEDRRDIVLSKGIINLPLDETIHDNSAIETSSMLESAAKWWSGSQGPCQNIDAFSRWILAYGETHGYNQHSNLNRYSIKCF